MKTYCYMSDNDLRFLLFLGCFIEYFQELVCYHACAGTLQFLLDYSQMRGNAISEVPKSKKFRLRRGGFLEFIIIMGVPAAPVSCKL